jgi:hypothetical protein
VIWDALTRVCEVQEGGASAWVSFKAPNGADINFYRPASAAPRIAEVVA